VVLNGTAERTESKVLRASMLRNAPARREARASRFA